MKLAMTGSHGFIGKRLSQLLHSRNFEVTELHHTDSQGELQRKLSGCHGVFHLGALFISHHKPTDIDNLIDANVRYTGRILEAMNQNGCKSLVLAGTTWQYTDESNPNPTSFYSATKRAGLELCRYYVSAEGFRVANLMIYDSYGDADPRPKLIPGLLKRVREPGLGAMNLSPGEQELCIVHVDDIAHAFLLASERMRSGLPSFQEFALRGPEVFKVKEIVAAIERISKKTDFAKLGATDYRPREIMTVWRGTPVLPDWIPENRFETWLKGIL